MKILFLVYHGFSDVSGISKKIFAQVKGLQQNGHEVHLCYYDRGSNGHWQRLVEVYPPSTSHYPPSTIHHQPSTINQYFDLQGRQLKSTPLRKGIYVTGGRKVVVK